MNVMELSGAVGGVVGAIKGAFVGFALYGWIGSILGIPIGFIFGLIVAVLLVILVFFVGIQKERFQQRWKLKSTFGRYWSKSRKEQWKELLLTIKCHEKVKGIVVCKFYYGVFLDTNHGFPVLLNSYQMIDNIQDINIGDTLFVFIKCLDSDESIIESSQKPPKIGEKI